ncbi:MAG TPA: N,N-dimethylformamidase beta subunit family domain-containing protein [Ktedonobacterales bacterium]|nr:N,N-dimethylformamidase beta subunit family domain-containing protein [Ktedonobacterales bacterium]
MEQRLVHIMDVARSWAKWLCPILAVRFILPSCTLQGNSSLLRPPPSPSVQRRGPIAPANANLGTMNWEIAETAIATNEIQAYASATSVAPGDTLTFYVSLLVEYARYSIDIYRFGWYGGAGGRLMRSDQRQGQAQGYYDEMSRTLISCKTCTLDKRSGLVDTHRKPSFALHVPTTWPTGVYEAKRTIVTGKQTFVTFEVRGNYQSKYAAIRPETTTAAYHQWGGYGLFKGYDDTYQTRARKLSLNRRVAGWGKDHGPDYAFAAIPWMERNANANANAYDLSYMYSVDLKEPPEWLRSHRADDAAVPELQRLMANVMTAIAVKHRSCRQSVGAAHAIHIG